ncbi:MAG: SDR family oxidoreductase [Pseudomonadota bacterium]
MANLALITGASSGIGAAFAKYHASKGGDLILVARREDRLKTLAAELEAAHGIKAYIYAMDLGGAANAKALYDAVKQDGHAINILINNAGFGGHGAHLDRDLDDEIAMIDLNVDALVALSHQFGRDMVARGSGKMLQVGSTAGMMPGPNQAVYFATKHFVKAFSQALDHEMRPKGVTSTVLAPGLVHTEFVEVANLGRTGLAKQKGRSAEFTAKVGYDAMMAGKLHVANEGALSFMTNWIIPLLPRRMVLNMVHGMQTTQ